MMNITAIPEVAHGMRPIIVIHKPDKSKPKGKKTFGFERSEMDAIKNLDKPYAKPAPVPIIPSSALLYIPASIKPFVLNRSLHGRNNKRRNQKDASKHLPT